MKDLSSFPDDQFVFLIRKLWQQKQKLKDWAFKNNKMDLVKTLYGEIELLKETERRLSK